MKKLEGLHKQWNAKIHKDNNNQVTKIDVVVGFNYQDCGGVNEHIGTFGFEIVRPAILGAGKSTFDLNAVANMLQSLQENPNSSDELVLQTHLTTHNSSQDLNKVKAFLELLTKPQDCQQVQQPQHPATQAFEAIATAWNLIPTNPTPLEILTQQTVSKTEAELFDLYLEITTALSNTNTLPSGHPKLISDFDQTDLRNDILSNIVTLITPVINQ